MANIGVVSLLLVSLAAGLMDLVYRRVPNALIVFGLVLQATLIAMLPDVALGAPLAPSVASALIGLALGFCVFFPLWRLGVMGAGDVKFIVMLGLALGPMGLFVTWLVSSVLVGMHALSSVFSAGAGSSAAVVWLAVQLSEITRPLVRVFAPVQRWLTSKRGRRRGAPYATYLAIGAFAWVFVLSRQ